MKSTTPSTPYLFVEIWVPKRAPYNDPKRGWPSIVGDFVKPLAEAHPDLIIWALQEGPWFQVCFAAPSPLTQSWPFYTLTDAQNTMRAIARERSFTIKRYIRNSTLGGALAGSRWLPKAKQGAPAESNRSFLLTQACHAAFAVYMDSLVRRGKKWVVESPECRRQNPHGNLFESFMHLVANMSEASFDVEVTARTRWMHEGAQKVQLKCHL